MTGASADLHDALVDLGVRYADGELSDERFIEAILALAKPQPEICICAAIRLPSGRIVRGHRHPHCIAAAGAMSYDDTRSADIAQATQGFVTSRDRFVDRWEGRRLQDAAGIPSAAPGGYRGDLLFSEDLY